MRFKTKFKSIGHDAPVYFIADISANHDGELNRAKNLIHLAAESGADAAKFQHFRASTIVSDRGFKSLRGMCSHQSAWKKTVSEVYQDASIPWEWTPELKKECDKVGIDFFSAPYEIEAVDMLDPFVEMFKIGSGDITWIELIRKIGRMGKPVMLATGASEIGDVQRAMRVLLQFQIPIVLMQCNTNYTLSKENFKFSNLNVLKTYALMYPNVIIGISDHTPGHSVVLGSVALGARVVEKHFTDDKNRTGPDHPFSMTPDSWREMVEYSRELELALGTAEKKIEDNEKETVIIQRRCARASRNLLSGTILSRNDISLLRPAPSDSIMPFDIDKIIGKRLKNDLTCGDQITWTMLDTIS